VYVDPGDERKRQRMAIAHVRRLRTERSGVLSTQVLQEYVNAEDMHVGTVIAGVRIVNPFQ
jgi:predicted nucleic acid-binding protein